MHVNWEMTGAEGVPEWEVAALRHGVMRLVLVKDDLLAEDRHWHITAAHNSDVVPVSLPA
jgi:hypothetical protein